MTGGETEAVRGDFDVFFFPFTMGWFYLEICCGVRTTVQRDPAGICVVVS